MNIFNTELQKLNSENESSQRWTILERLHILGQINIRFHFKVHFLMLQEAVFQKQPLEFFGQLLRLLLIIPGHLLNKLPIGNVGTSRVSAFKPMPIPKDLLEQLNNE